MAPLTIILYALYVIAGIVFVHELENYAGDGYMSELRAIRVTVRILLILFWAPLVALTLVWMFGNWLFGWIFS